MKLLVALSLSVFGSLLWAQTPTYTIPKASGSFSLRTTDFGPRPGSAVPENGPDSETFRRVYAYPAQVRLVVRAACDAQISDKALIDEAQTASEPGKGPTQIDWQNVPANEFKLLLVLHARREEVRVPLTAKDGKYVAGGTDRKESEEWEVVEVKMPNNLNPCLKRDQISNSDLKKAVYNALNSLSLKNFRKG